MRSALVHKARVRTNARKDSVCGVRVQATEFAQLCASYPDSAPFVDPKSGKPPAGYAESVTGADWQSKIRGRTGIVCFADYWARSIKEKESEQPSGDHIDLWNGTRLTATGMRFFSTMGRRLGLGSLGAGTSWGYSDLSRSYKILFWEIQ